MAAAASWAKDESNLTPSPTNDLASVYGDYPLAI
jgi:hypothetical protein